MHLDLSVWDYQHILRWFEMLYETDLCDSPDGSPVRIFSEMINDQFILRMPQNGKSKLREGLKKFFSEAHSLIENSTVYTEDGEKCLTMSEAAAVLGISEEEITEFLTEAGIGEFVLTSDQTYKLQ